MKIKLRPEKMMSFNINENDLYDFCKEKGYIENCELEISIYEILCEYLGIDGYHEDDESEEIEDELRTILTGMAENEMLENEEMEKTTEELWDKLWHKRLTLTKVEEILTDFYGVKIMVEMPDEQNSPDYTFYYYDEKGEIDGAIYALPTRENTTSVVYFITEIDFA